MSRAVRLSLLISSLALLAACAPVAKKGLVTSPADTSVQAGTPTDGETENRTASDASQEVPSEGTESTGPKGPELPFEVGDESLEDAELAADLDASPLEGEEVSPAPHDELAVSPPVPTEDEIERERTALAEEIPRFDIPMVVNEKVTAFVDYFAGPHREKFLLSLERSGRYLPMIQRIFAEAGIPKDLAYMAHVESAFKTNAYSRAKAKGMFQFILSTGRRYGLHVDTWVDDRSDPEKSARAAAAYLKDLYAMFGDWYLALAAYNAGEGKIGRAIRRTGKSDFWGIAKTSTIRTETKNYVPAILAATLLSKDPSRYNLLYVPQPPLEYEVAEVTGAVDLRVLARAAGIEAETLKELNPHLRRGQTPPDRSFQLRVPVGMATATLAALESIPERDRIVVTRHVVRKGETLGAIARHYRVSVPAIQAANRMGKRTLLSVGRELVIPVSGSYASIADSWSSDWDAEPIPETYRVRSGDTLSSIGRRFRTTPSAIAAASGIQVDQTLRVGDRLRIPTGGSPAAPGRAVAKSQPTAKGTKTVHTVRRGETLTLIAARYRTSVARLCSLNQISPDDTLHPGRRLTVRSN